MGEITIKQASEPADLDAVRALCWDYRQFLLTHSDIDREITETFYPVPKYAALMADLPRIHARPAGVMLLALDAAGQPVGCGMIHPLDPRTSEIKRVFVTDAARGKRVASTLCEALITQARNDGFERVVLDTSRTLTAAQALYARLGFEARGPYQPIPADIVQDLRFYELSL
jgi:GNAT superfamily N-acetyltransferase